MNDEMSDSDSNTICGTKRVSVRQLIKLVREHRCLWDRALPSYKHRQVKDDAWREICTALKPDYRDMSDVQKMKFANNLTRKWYNVRDAYVKSRRTESRNRPYLYSELLTFVDHIYFGENAVAKRHMRNTADVFSGDTIPEDTASNDEDEIETQHSLINEVYVDNEEKPTKKPKTDEEGKLFNDTEDYNSIVGVLANLINREEDEDRAFFKSITPAVKKLSESKKFQFRIRVMKLLEELRKNDGDNFNMKIERVSNDESDTE